MIKTDWVKRTYKRETAVTLLIIWVMMTLASTFRFLIFYPDNPVLLTAMGSAFGTIYSIATTMIFLFAGAAFGMDYYAKQLKPMGAA